MNVKKLGRKVPPTSTMKIRHDANLIRDVLGLGNKRVNMIEVIEFVLPMYQDGFYYDVLTAEEMGEDEARTYPDKLLMEIREDTYRDITNGGRRGQFTLAHELGHLVMHAGLKKTVSFARGGGHQFYEDSEWQANQFAAEFLMPYEETIACKSPTEIYNQFGVSSEAAEFRYRKLN